MRNTGLLARGILAAVTSSAVIACAAARADDALPASEELPPPVVAEEPNADFLNFDVAGGSAQPAGFEEPMRGPLDEESLNDLEELAARARKEVGIVYLGDGPPPAYAFGYNRVTSATTWLPGHDNKFGWFSYEWFGGARVSDLPTLVTGFGVHFLDGPVQTDMPPRLFDFAIGVSDRRLIRPNVGYDIQFRVGAFSDFEGSADDGIRYPGHAVAFFRFSRQLQFALGIDYLDRDDISLLPVAGLIWTPTSWLKMEAVFPRPRIATRIMGTSHWLFLGGELGGGTWAIERVGLVNDNATYSDLRLILGWETGLEKSLSSSLEVGYVFDRELSYRSGVGDYDPTDGLMLRATARY